LYRERERGLNSALHDTPPPPPPPPPPQRRPTPSKSKCHNGQFPQPYNGPRPVRLPSPPFHTTPPYSPPNRAILDLKTQRDKLHQYQRRITHLTALETSAARTLLAKGDKPRALLALRRKKYQESLLAKTDAQLEQLERLTSSVEFALIQKDVLFGLQQGTRVLKEIHREMGGIENVEKLMGETAEAIEYQRVCFFSFFLSILLLLLPPFFAGGGGVGCDVGWQ
jgi:hypothetical protein